jgi:hypothetical protein
LDGYFYEKVRQSPNDSEGHKGRPSSPGHKLSQVTS